MSPPSASFPPGEGPAGGPDAQAEAGRLFDFVGAPVFCRARGRTSSAAAAALFLHGAADSSDDFARLFSRLGRRRALAAFDFVGFGRSGDAPGFGYGLADQADVALAAALALGIGRAHLVAHGSGGAVAAELLARRERGLSPLRIESLALLDGGPLADLGRHARRLRWVRTLAPGARPARSLALALFRQAFARAFGDPAVLGPGEATRAYHRFVEGPAGPRDPRALAYADELLHPPARWWAALARLDLPALIVWGGRDRIAGPEHARLLGRQIPGARVRVLPGLGHAPYLEAPDAVAAELEAFWGELDGP